MLIDRTEMTIEFSHYGIRCVALVIREIGRFYLISFEGKARLIGESQIIRKIAA